MKNTILENENKIIKIIFKIYEICFKNRVFFWKVIVGYKMKIKRVITALKIEKMIIMKYV